MMGSLHSKKWFKIYVENAGYTEEETELLWQSLSTDQIDLMQALMHSAYMEGARQGRDELMC